MKYSIIRDWQYYEIYLFSIICIFCILKVLTTKLRCWSNISLFFNDMERLFSRWTAVLIVLKLRNPLTNSPRGRLLSGIEELSISFLFLY